MGSPSTTPVSGLSLSVTLTEGPEALEPTPGASTREPKPLVCKAAGLATQVSKLPLLSKPAPGKGFPSNNSLVLTDWVSGPNALDSKSFCGKTAFWGSLGEYGLSGV